MFIKCPNCGFKTNIEEKLLGKKIECADCNFEFTAKRLRITRKKAKKSRESSFVTDCYCEDQTHTTEEVEFKKNNSIPGIKNVAVAKCSGDDRWGFIFMHLLVLGSPPLFLICLRDSSYFQAIILSVPIILSILAFTVIEEFSPLGRRTFICTFSAGIILAIITISYNEPRSPIMKIEQERKQNAGTGWGYDGLLGRVKEVVTTDYNIVKKFGEDVNEMKSKAISKYDERGNRIEQEEYSSDGALTNKSVSKFDFMDKWSESKWYGEDGLLRMTVIPKYDTKGNKTEVAMYNTGGLLGKNIFKYDAKGNMIEESKYDATGALIHKTVSKYDAKGNRIEFAEYDANAVSLVKYIFEYDEKGNNTWIVNYDKDRLMGKIHQRFLRDGDGNRYGAEYYDDKGRFTLLFSYRYDDKGNLIENSTWDCKNKNSIKIKIQTRSYTYY